MKSMERQQRYNMLLYNQLKLRGTGRWRFLLGPRIDAENKETRHLFLSKYDFFNDGGGDESDDGGGDHGGPGRWPDRRAFLVWWNSKAEVIVFDLTEDRGANALIPSLYYGAFSQ